MKKILSTFCCSILIVLCLGQSSISIEEAKILNLLESNKAKKSTDLINLYKANENTFSGFIIINYLLENREIKLLSENSDDVYLKFAKLLNKNKNEALPFIDSINNPMEKNFLQAWYVLRNTKEINQITFFNRYAIIVKELQKVKTKLFILSFESKIDSLFSYLEKWNSPIEYEVSIIYVKEIFNESSIKQKQLINKKINDYFNNNIPTLAAPPYTRTHTNFYAANLLIKSVGDKFFLGSLNLLKESKNPDISRSIKETIGWINSSYQYPVEYHTLYLLFNK